VDKFVTLIVCLPLMLFANSSLVHADTDENNTSKWNSELGLGYVKTTGNTRTQSIKATAKTLHERKQWRHSASLEALNTSENDKNTAERYLLTGKIDYKYTKYNYWYLTASYENDRFSGYDRRTSESVGYGRRLLENEKITLDTEIGPGARQTKFDTGEHTRELIGRIAASFKWKISNNSDFGEEVFSEIGDKTTVTKTVTSVKASINSQLAMKLSYTVKYTSDVPIGTKKTDTESVVTLVYNYH